MGLETCFQVSTVAHSTTVAAAARNSIAPANKLSLPACRGTRTAAFSFSASTSRLPPALGFRSTVVAPRKEGRGGRIVCEAKNVVAGVLDATEANWESLVIGNKLVVLVDFWAPWCGPCRMIEPTVEQLAKDFAGKVICVKVNTDESPNLATKYNIRSIPTMLIFKDGDRKEVIVGAVPLGTLVSSLNKYLD